MSDDEEVYVKRQKTIHYGSLEEQEFKNNAERVEEESDEHEQEEPVQEVSKPAKEAGNIHVSDGEFSYLINLM